MHSELTIQYLPLLQLQTNAGDGCSSRSDGSPFLRDFILRHASSPSQPPRPSSDSSVCCAFKQKLPAGYRTFGTRTQHGQSSPLSTGAESNFLIK